MPQLLVRVGQRSIALDLADVFETMRPMPIEPIPNAPPWVAGVSTIRGNPVPVVDLATLLGSQGDRRTRLVAVKAGSRIVALLVDEVVGIREIGGALAGLPPLLGEAPADIVRSIGRLDDRLVLVLETAKLVPESLHVESARHDP